MLKHLTYGLMAAAAMSLGLTSCSSDDPYELCTSKATNSGNLFRVPLDSALMHANKAFEQLAKENTRSTNRRVCDVKYISSSDMKTRSGGTNDTLLYIVNYADNAGFAVLSADSRSEVPIYAISDSEAFQINNDTNPIIQKWLDNVLMSIPLDTLNNHLQIVPPRYDDPPHSLYDPVYNMEIAPMIGHYQSRLKPIMVSQYCTNPQGEPCLTGCVAIGVEILMSYYKYPFSYGGQNFDWDAMNAGEDYDGIARLVYQLGLPENLDNMYHSMDANAGAYHTNIPQTLSNFGYTSSHIFQYLAGNETAFQADLMDGPICLYAKCSRERSAHVWVIDGLLKSTRLISLPRLDLMGGEEEIRHLYHCVWGNGGTCNGFYYFTGSFIGRPDVMGDDDPYDFHGDVWIYHDQAVQYLPNIVLNR